MDPLVALALQALFGVVAEAAKHIPAVIAAIESSPSLSPEEKEAALAKLREHLKATEALVASVRFLDDPVPPPAPTRPG